MSPTRKTASIASKPRGDKPASPLRPAAKPQGKQAATDAPTQRYRDRMELVGKLLQNALEELSHDPVGSDAVGRGLYLHILGAVFETLDGMTQDYGPDDLLKLSKVIAEQRRAEGQCRRAGQVGSKAKGRSRANPQTSPPADAGESGPGLSPALVHLVRQVYGTNFAPEIPPQDLPASAGAAPADPSENGEAGA